MDIVNEQLIIRKDRPIEKIMKIMIISIAIVIILLCMTISVLKMFGSFSSLFVIVAAVIAVATFFYIKSLSIEYEYSLTNGEFDIEKIMGKSKRKMMYSLNLREVEEFGNYDMDKERLQNREFSFRVSPVNLLEGGIFYCVVRDREHGVGLILVQPNEKMQDAMSKFIKRSLQQNIKDWNVGSL